MIRNNREVLLEEYIREYISLLENAFSNLFGILIIEMNRGTVEEDLTAVLKCLMLEVESGITEASHMWDETKQEYSVITREK